MKVLPAGNRGEVAELMRNVRDAVVLEHQPRSQLGLRFGQLLRRDPLARHAVDLENGSVLEPVERSALGCRRRDGVHEGFLGRNDTASDSGGETGTDEGLIQTGA